VSTTSEVETFVRDLATRALHTFWQTFTAGIAVEWAGSGLDVNTLTTLSAWHKVLLMLIAAAAAAALSTVKSLAANTTVRRQATTVAGDALQDDTGLDVDRVLADAHVIVPTTTETGA